MPILIPSNHATLVSISPSQFFRSFVDTYFAEDMQNLQIIK